jgi:hypothetical protein
MTACPVTKLKKLFFSGLKTPTWPVRPLIALDILFLSYLNSFEVTRLAINLPLGVLKKYCYLLE